jgi:eukaryotic-like serine/threonine-protein kinase
VETQGGSAWCGGRFLLGERLGASEGRDVFLARDTVTERDVVLKRARRGAGDGLLREHLLLSRVRAALGNLVPEPIAAGLGEAQPWFATVRVEGHNLRELMHKLWPYPVLSSADGRGSSRRIEPDRLATVLSLALDLAVALARLHALGVVHGDLSPDNVLLTSERRLVLIDFEGATSLFSRQGGEATVRVTPGYAAPEALRGQLIDCRADMYSWACIVRELLSGEPVFSGATIASLARLHLDAAPKPLATVVAGAPEWLDALLLALLEKEPRKRRSSARSLATELAERVGGRDVSVALEAICPPLNQPGFVGRHGELRRLEERLDAAAQGSGGVIVVRADAGFGKTALLGEIAGRARERRCRVLAIRAMAPDRRGHELARAPQLPLQLLELRASDPAPASLLEAQRACLVAWASWLPELQALHPASSAAAPLVPPEALPPEALRRRAFRALAELIRELGQREPWLLVIDDLHSFDELSLGFLGSREAEALRNARVSIVAAAAVAACDAPPLDEVVSRALEVIDLPGLDRASSLVLLHELLGSEQDDGAFAGFVHEHCDGNPLYITEMVRLAVERGSLRFDVARGWVLPDPAALRALRSSSLEETLRRRLLPLAARTLYVASLGAVVGRSFRASELGALDDTLGEELPPALLELVSHDVIRSRGDAYVFVHELVRSACEHRLAEAERRHLHARQAERLGLEAGEDARLSLAIGRHWAHAGRTDRAVPSLLRAAERMEASSELHGAIASLRLALEQLRADAPGIPWSERAVETARRLLGLYGRTARHAALRALGEELLAAGEPDWRAQYDARLHLARSFRVTGDYASATLHLARAERLLRERRRGGFGHESLWLELQEQRIWLAYMKRDVQDIGPLLQRMAPVVRRRGSATQLASFYMWSANDLVLRNRYSFSPTAVDQEKQGLALLERAGALPELAMTEFDLAFMLILGDLEHCAEALSHLERARGLAEKLSDPVLAARAATYLAIAQRRLGHVQACRDWARAALEESRLSGIRGYTGAAHACLGWVAWRQDSVAAALDCFAEAQASWWHKRDRPGARTRDEFPFQWLAHLPLLVIHASRDAWGPAEAACEELLAESQQRLAGPVDEILARLPSRWRAADARALDAELTELTRRAARLGYI